MWRHTDLLSWLWSPFLSQLPSCTEPPALWGFNSVIAWLDLAFSLRNQKSFNNNFYDFTELQIRFVKLTSIYSTCVISPPNSMFYHLLESSRWDEESSRWDDSNKWSNIGFGEEIGILGNKKRSLSGALISSCWYNWNKWSSWSFTQASLYDRNTVYSWCVIK